MNKPIITLLDIKKENNNLKIIFDADTFNHKKLDKCIVEFLLLKPQDVNYFYNELSNFKGWECSFDILKSGEVSVCRIRCDHENEIYQIPCKKITRTKRAYNYDELEIKYNWALNNYLYYNRGKEYFRGSYHNLLYYLKDYLRIRIKTLQAEKNKKIPKLSSAVCDTIIKDYKILLSYINKIEVTNKNTLEDFQYEIKIIKQRFLADT